MNFNERENKIHEITEGVCVASRGILNFPDTIEDYKIDVIINVSQFIMSESMNLSWFNRLVPMDLWEDHDNGIYKNFENAAKTIESYIFTNKKVLIIGLCKTTNPVLAVMAWMVYEHGKSVHDAIERIREVLPEASPDCYMINRMYYWEQHILKKNE